MDGLLGAGAGKSKGKGKRNAPSDNMAGANAPKVKALKMDVNLSDAKHIETAKDTLSAMQKAYLEGQITGNFGIDTAVGGDDDFEPSFSGTMLAAGMMGPLRAAVGSRDPAACAMLLQEGQSKRTMDPAQRAVEAPPPSSRPSSPSPTSLPGQLATYPGVSSATWGRRQVQLVLCSTKLSFMTRQDSASQRRCTRS